MTPKQRVTAALRREPHDRVPIFMWFHPETAAALADILEVPRACVSHVMGDDILQAWVGNNFAMEGITHEHDGERHTDPWGVEWVKEGPFNQIRRSPLQEVDESDLQRYRFPFEDLDRLLANMESILPHAGEKFIGCDISPCLFEMMCRLRGMEQAVLDLALLPPGALALYEHATEFALRTAEEACARFPLDWLWTGDDVGGQQAMIISPDCWRSVIRPHLERIFRVGKTRGLFVAYHCCGAIRPIIPDLVEMGLDVLNPVQANCPGMEPADLKAEFGRDLAFMGGVDTQQLLPHGSETDVRRATESLLETMTAGGGGYILAASHTVPPETPMANIFAMYEAAGRNREEILDSAADTRKRSTANGAPAIDVRIGEELR